MFSAKTWFKIALMLRRLADWSDPYYCEDYAGPFDITDVLTNITPTDTPFMRRLK